MVLPFIIVKGRTSSKTHVAIGFRRSQQVLKHDYRYNQETKRSERYVKHQYVSDFVFTACGYYFDTSGKVYDDGPTCAYCYGYMRNMEEILGQRALTPEEWIAGKP